jgi:His/Glu/Gln/Arg/opine family amino acid ABC transporter permease subunit
MMVTGVKLTLILLVTTTITSLLLGTVIAIMRLSRIRFLRFSGTLYVEVCRNIPGLFWLLFFFFVFPELLPYGLGDKLNAYVHYPVVAGIIGLTIDNSSYVSDILRSGRMAIPYGQREAAITLGLSRVQQWTQVLLPSHYPWSEPCSTMDTGTASPGLQSSASPPRYKNGSQFQEYFSLHGNISTGTHMGNTADRITDFPWY